MHAVLRSTRIAARSVSAASWSARAVVAAPSIAPQAPLRLQTRLFRTSFPFANSPTTSTTEPVSDTPAATPSETVASTEDAVVHTPEIATSAPSTSPAPIDSETATTLPTEEIPAVSSPSLDATKPSSSAVSAEAEAHKVASTVFVGGLSWNVDNDWLEDEVLALLDRTDGVAAIRIARDHMGRSKGFAFVELDSPELATQIVGTKPVIDGRQVEFTPSNASAKKPSREPKREPRNYDNNDGPRNPPSTTVWLGNVAWSADEAVLEQAFSRYGEIKRIGQPKDFETGRSRGIAYLEFATLEQAEEVVKAGFERGFRVDGRPVRVDFASASQRGDNKGRVGSSAGGRGGGRSGGGGGRGGDRGGDRQQRRQY